MELFCLGDLSIHSMYLSIQPFILVWSHEYLLYLLDYNPISFILLVKYSSFGHWEFFQFFPVSLEKNPNTAGFLRSLTFWHKTFTRWSDSSCVFPAPNPEAAFLQGALLMDSGPYKPRSGPKICSLWLWRHCFQATWDNSARKYICILV